MRISTAYKLLILTLIALVGHSELSAQRLPERRLVRKGNEQFNKANYRSSLDYYDKALEEVPGGYAPTYNKANAYLQYLIANPADTLYSWEMSNTLYEDIANDTLLSEKQRAEAYRNIGESLMLQQNHEAALNAFRESLKLNPDDDATKYNYVLAKRIVDQKRNQQQNQQNQDNQQDNQQNEQNNDNQNQNQNNQQDQSQDGQNDKNEQNNDQQDNSDDKQDNQQNDKQNDQQDEEQSDKQEGNDNGGQQPEGLTEDQERLLDAIQAEEDKTQEKLNDKKVIYIPGKKNW